MIGPYELHKINSERKPVVLALDPSLTGITSDEGISHVVGDAGADGVVLDDAALGVDAADLPLPGARVHALVVAAGQAGRAVLVHLALAAAAEVRVAKVAGRALAGAALAGGRGDGVGAARVGHARVDGLGLGADATYDNFITLSAV